MVTSRSKLRHEYAIWQVSPKEILARLETSEGGLTLVDVVDSDPVVRAAVGSSRLPRGKTDVRFPLRSSRQIMAILHRANYCHQP